MTTTLEKIAAREQQIAEAADALRAQIDTLADRLRELDAEANDLAVARKVILALGQDDPPPAALPDNPVYQHILTVLADARTPLRLATCAAPWTWAPSPTAWKPCAPSSNAWSPPASSPRTSPACSPWPAHAPTTDPRPAPLTHTQRQNGHHVAFSSLRRANTTPSSEKLQ